MGRETTAQAVGWIVGLGVAVWVAHAMFSGGGGLGLPSGRYPVILLIALAVGPPLIAGGIAGAAAFGLAFVLMKPIEAASDERRARRRADMAGAVHQLIASASEEDGRDYVRNKILPALKAGGGAIESPLRAAGVHEGATVFHVAAAQKKWRLIEALAAEGPSYVAAAANGKLFDEIGTPEERKQARAAFARGYASFVESEVPAAEKPVSPQEREAWEQWFPDWIDRHRASGRVTMSFDAGVALGLVRKDAARELIEAGNGEQAQTLLESAKRCLKGRPDMAGLFVLSGRAHRLLKDDARAIQEYDAALKLDPKNDEAFYRRARSLEALGRPNEAIADFDRALSINSNHVSALIDRGVAMLNHLNHPALAVADFRRAVALDPANELARSNLDNVLKRYGADEAALETEAAAIAANPGDIEARLRRASGRRIAGDAAGALQDVAAVLELEPNHVAALTERYRINRDANNAQTALADVLRLEQLLPNEAWPVSNVGLMYERLGQKAEAASWYRKALVLSADDAVAKPGLARVSAA